jgi:hypothetical protein
MAARASSARARRDGRTGGNSTSGSAETDGTDVTRVGGAGTALLRALATTGVGVALLLVSTAGTGSSVATGVGAAAMSSGVISMAARRAMLLICSMVRTMTDVALTPRKSMM